MSIRTFIQHNFWLKLFSLILAMLIWFAIHFAIKNNFRLAESSPAVSTREDLLRLPVRVLTRPGDNRLFTVNPKIVMVAVTAQEAVLRDLSSKNIAAYVDIADIHSQHETNQQVRLDVPDGVTIVRMTPRAVNVEQVLP